ncbi:Transcription elongation factor family protein, partial [Perilla frutescens var. hirtella]
MSSQPKGNQFERKELLKIGKNKKKKESCPTEIALLVESVLAELHVAVEEDAELNRQEKPAITKLRNLSLLTDIIPRKHLQQEFLDRGVLDALREWLEALPDGSIPSIDVRATVLKCLNDLTIDLEHSVRRDQMKSSGIGKAVMFYYKYEEETTANWKLAKALVEKW